MDYTIIEKLTSETKLVNGCYYLIHINFDSSTPFHSLTTQQQGQAIMDIKANLRKVHLHHEAYWLQDEFNLFIACKFSEGNPVVIVALALMVVISAITVYGLRILTSKCDITRIAMSTEKVAKSGAIGIGLTVLGIIFLSLRKVF